MPWIDWFRNLLCRMMKELGKDCAELGQTPPDWVAAIAAAYAGVVPTFPTPQAQAGFLLLLDELDKCLDDPRNPLSPGDTKTIRDLIATLRGVIPVI